MHQENTQRDGVPWGYIRLVMTMELYAGYYNLINMRNNRLTVVVTGMSTGFSSVYKDSHTMICNISMKSMEAHACM